MTSMMVIQRRRHGPEAQAHNHVPSTRSPSLQSLHKNSHQSLCPLSPNSLFSLISLVCPVFRSPNSWHPVRKLERPRWLNTRSSFKGLWVKITKTVWMCLALWMKTWLSFQNTAHPPLTSPVPVCLHPAVIPPLCEKAHLPLGDICPLEGTSPHVAVCHQGEKRLPLGISPPGGMFIEGICHQGGTFLQEDISLPSPRQDDQHPQEGISQADFLPEAVGA